MSETSTPLSQFSAAEMEAEMLRRAIARTDAALDRALLTFCALDRKRLAQRRELDLLEKILASKK